MRPPVLSPRDLLPWGCLAALLIGAAAGCFVFHAGWGFDLVAVFGAVLASFGYGRIVLGRWRLARDVFATTRNGLYLLRAPFTLDTVAVADEVDRTMAAWAKVVPNAAELVRGVYVLFETYPFRDAILPYPGGLAGLTETNWRGVKGAYCVRVGWKPDMRLTALGHELGHVVLMRSGRDPSEDALAEAAKTYGVPY